jgi:hypothetical protein
MSEYNGANAKCDETQAAISERNRLTRAGQNAQAVCLYVCALCVCMGIWACFDLHVCMSD